MNPRYQRNISQLTICKDEQGNKLGMFGGGELGWYPNGNSRHLIDKILIEPIACKR